MRRIFISYRREDEVHLTGRIYDRLVGRFGSDNVFKDVDSIPVGVDFRQVLRDWINQSDMVLVVIGAFWLKTRDEKTGGRRLDGAGDFVRFEIETALERGTPVIPVLVGQTRMPDAKDLPPTIRKLAFTNAARIRPDPDFHRDMDHLIQDLEKNRPAGPPGADSTQAKQSQRRAGPTKAGAGRAAEVEDGAEPRAVHNPTAAASLFEQLWRELGPAGAMENLESRLRDDDERWLRDLLRFLRRRKESASIPVLFHLLAHPSELIRRRAKAIVQAFGWSEITSASVGVARRGGDERGAERVGYLLEGLAAIQADADAVTLLERLIVELSGGLRMRAILLLERKRLGLQLDEIAALFREKESPYAIVKPLGQGLVTAAYQATHEMTGRPVVVRVLRPEFVAQPRILAQFLDVSKKSFGYVHQSLVHIRDVQAISDHRIYYTVRDYVDGVTLQAVLSEKKRFEPAQALEILRQVLEALTPVHREGAFHGGIKSSNIFLCDGERVRVILGDPSLPLVGATDLDRLSYDYRYAPPELFRGGASPEPRSDFYSLGCLAYELLCGDPPFLSDNAFELISRHGQEAIPPPSRRGCVLGTRGDAWVVRLLAKSPAQRHADLEEALGALKALQDELKPPTAGGPRPVTILGRDSLVRYDVPESIVRLSGGVAADWTGDHGASMEHNTPETIPPRSTDPLGGDPEGADVLKHSGHLHPGEVFGRYTIVRMLGQGGMGTVYEAYDSLLSRRVALKVTRLKLNASEFRVRFKREAQVGARLTHPNICPIFDLGEVGGIVYLTMPYLEGETLNRVLSRGPLPAGDAVEITRVLAHALQSVHDRGIIHRDLKPANIMMSPDRGPIIMDFGIARQEDAGDSFSTAAGAIIGTPAFMAPEQMAGKHLVDPRADIYSLGVILYEMLSGVLPFRGSVMEILAAVMNREPEPLTTLVPGIDPRLDRICRRAMAKQVDDRYASMAKLAGDLDRFLEGPSDSQAGGWWRRLKGRFRLADGRRKPS